MVGGSPHGRVQLEMEREGWELGAFGEPVWRRAWVVGRSKQQGEMGASGQQGGDFFVQGRKGKKK